LINRIRILCVLGVVLCSAQLTAAQTVLDAVAELPALVDSQLLESKEESAIEKIYPLGTVSRISGRLRFADELTVSGGRNLATWQLSPVHQAPEAFRQGRELLQQRGARLLFWCEGRDCGPSNLWANAVLGNARLYGPDERQMYAVLTDAATRELFTLYAVTRGNGRGMLHTEQFLADSLPDKFFPATATLLLQLRTDGFLELVDADGAANLEVVQLARALNRDISLRVLLSGVQAANWRDELISAGVRAPRLETGDTAGAATVMEVLR
jgi:hypothetical protein